MNALPEDLSSVLRHLEACYPNEGCGVILKGPDGKFLARPMANVYDRYHEKDPERFPRTSRTAYLFDPKEWLKVSEEADRVGQSVTCIFHSHADVGAYFSREDREMAAPDGEPLMPEVTYLVVAVDKGQCTRARAYAWNGADFTEAEIPLR